MNRTIKFATLLAICLPVAAYAHKPWFLPSITVSTVDQWVTVDAAVSDGVFYFDHQPLRIDALAITAPDGAPARPENVSTGKYRTTFDLHLTQNGTYRLANVNKGVFASYEENGATKRWRGTATTLATEIPANAQKLQVSESAGRVETFVTAGRPTLVALKPTNAGLELVPVTHPNDLYAGEAARFRFLLDGKPAANLPVTVVPGGVRYRDSQNEIKLTTDTNGEVSINWPSPGMYWLQSSLQDDKTSLKQAKQRRVTYSATLEVLPQ